LWLVSLLIFKAPFLKLLAFQGSFNFEVTRLTESLDPGLSVPERADSLVTTELKLTHKKHSDKLIEQIELSLEFLQGLSVSECFVLQNGVHEVAVLLR